MKSYIQAKVFEVQIVASQQRKDQIKGERFFGQTHVSDTSTLLINNHTTDSFLQC